MREETKEYIESWQTKLAKHGGDTLEDFFETFFGQYKSMRLIDDVSRLLLAKEKIKKLGEDKNAATKNNITACYGTEIITVLKDNKYENDIEHIITLIEDEAFHIKYAERIAV